jgi:hypothetical protein
MARPLRLESAGALCPVTRKGQERKALFYGQEGRENAEEVPLHPPWQSGRGRLFPARLHAGSSGSFSSAPNSSPGV